MHTYEIQIEMLSGRSLFMLVAAQNADEARLVARDLLLEMQRQGPDLHREMTEATVYLVNAQRLPNEAA